MQERLQKILSQYGVCSRRAAEALIEAGRVEVNGVPAQLGARADVELDAITLDGQSLQLRPGYRYLMLHKPRGYVTTLCDERGRPSVAQLVRDCPARVYPVGRLDMDSEGLLLLTNDGALANRLMHPSGGAGKTYLVTVGGFRPEALQVLRAPLLIDGYRIRPAEVTVQTQQGGRTVLQFVIHEGRNRQIRKMCAQAGLAVHRLQRIAENGVKLGDLPPGAWRDLTDEELRLLRGEPPAGGKD